MNHLQFVALTYEDGSLGVMQLMKRPRLEPGAVLPGLDPETGQRELSDEAIQHEIDRSALPRRVVSWRRIDPSELPQDRTYRDAWRDRGGRIDHDMPKAREICRARLRAMRAPMLAGLDVEYQRADEDGDAGAKRRIATRKQRLRDVTADPRIEHAADTRGLDAIVRQLGTEFSR